MPKTAALRRRLLDWYDRNRRALPWRAAPDACPDPYRVWLSEIMLQQTTVATARPYFLAFVERWPTVADLAAAEIDDVLHAWQGLGYYARARNLWACARAVVADGGGRFPEDEAALRALPGVGAYTAAAIAAVAFGRPAVPVDGNVERVLSRMFAIDQPAPGRRRLVVGHAETFAAAERPGDFAQALMELGAIVCRPRRPRCAECPWRADCRAYAAGTPEAYPARAAKAAKPTRRGIAFWAVRGDGRVLLRRRPEGGLLGGMMEVPSTPWREAPWGEAEAVAAAPLAGPWRRLDGGVRHTFTHFDLELAVMAARVGRAPAADGVWWPTDRLDEKALPTVMKKVARLALARAAQES